MSSNGVGFSTPVLGLILFRCNCTNQPIKLLHSTQGQAVEVLRIVSY